MKIRSTISRLISYASPSKQRPLILMYHRIADVQADYWGLAVSPSLFEEQLHVLRRTRYPVALRDFVRSLAAGTLRSDAVALTFDDGYVDNLLNGKPILAAADIPATVFLATGYLDRPGEFWWDRLTTLVLLEKNSRSFDLMIGGKKMSFHLSADQSSASRTERETALLAIWEAMRRVGDDEREKIMTELQSILSATEDVGARGRPMTRKEVRQLVSDGLITIGAHTATHPVLSELGPADRDREITESKKSCEEIAEEPATGFSYPYGNFSVDTRNAVKSAGFEFACSSQYRPTNVGHDIFALPRINVRDSNGNAFEQSLHWASALS